MSLTRLHRKKVIEVEPETPEEIAARKGIAAAELSLIDARVTVELVNAAIEWGLEPGEYLDLITPIPLGMTLSEQIKSLKRE